jgi:hypothetical protein
VTCASCGRDLLADDAGGYGTRCRCCAGRPARGILVAFALSTAIWWLVWRLATWILAGPRMM